MLKYYPSKPTLRDYEQLEYIKKQDDILRRLVKLPPIHEDIRKMGFGGIDNINEINMILRSKRK